MTRRFSFSLASLFVLLTMMAQKSATAPSPNINCPSVKIEPVRLPDLNVPRSGHGIFYVNGEITVTGGHTSGFIPTPTAEYYKDGEWHLIQMVYDHDAGIYVPLKSGKVLLCGGFEKHLGIGQTFVVEMYDPTTHTFEGFGCLDHKRASARGIELDSGKVVITGNWYADDAIEYFDGHEGFSHGKAVSQQRTLPFVFRISRDDVMIFSRKGIKGEVRDSIIIDRLQGEPFQSSLFDTWKPIDVPLAYNCDNSFIGDQTKDVYAYLFPVEDEKGQIAIAQTHGTEISLLPTTCPIPMHHLGKPILYYTPVIVDRQAKRGYLVGIDHTCHHYVVRIDYAQKPASLTLYYTDPIPDAGGYTPILTPEGDLVFAGGSNGMTVEGKPNTNFRPFSSTILFRFGSHAETGLPGKTAIWLIIGILVIVSILAMLMIKFLMRRQPKNKNPQQKLQNIRPKSEVIQQKPEEEEARDEPLSDGDQNELMQRILHLVVEKKMYLNSDLTTSDIAKELGLHRNQVSACINSQKGQGFSQLVNRYRVEHAKDLMRQHPEMKLSSVGIESGFANETSFYRTFKTITGTTPTEWKSKD